jgi:hypothetical protein
MLRTTIGTLLRLALITVLAFAATASPAAAGWRIDRATAIAQKVWHHPCVDQMRIEWADPRPFHGTEDAIDVAAWSYIEPDCIVYFNDAQPLKWEQFCTAMLHEAGHLANFRDPANGDAWWHSSSPRSVMRTGIGYDYVVEGGERRMVGGDRRCRNRGRPFLQRHGLLRRVDPV